MTTNSLIIKRLYCCFLSKIYDLPVNGGNVKICAKGIVRMRELEKDQCCTKDGINRPFQNRKNHSRAYLKIRVLSS